MADLNPAEKAFIAKLADIIGDHISNEQFGVSQLAAEADMSRSNLLRKVKKLTGLSASQFIRQVRLREAMDLLREGTENVSGVAYKVGFGSPSYFIKCFREYYGFPPGEVAKGQPVGDDSGDGSGGFHIHQLSAIMFTDIQGYTALMQQDEATAVKYRTRHREVFNAAVEKFRGRILQYYGDGTLSTFASAIDAVRCGTEMQLAFAHEPKIPVRIGIHSGDIIFTEDDIIGDGVNVASRIESLAVTGSVFISEKIYDEVKNQPSIQCVSMGSFILKNVDKPMEVFAIANAGLMVPSRKEIEGKASPVHARKNTAERKPTRTTIYWAIFSLAAIALMILIYATDLFNLASGLRNAAETQTAGKSIAVLPFINDSEDSSNVYLINGLMESILSNLQKIEDLRVVSRTSVEKYRNSPKLIREIAGELNVKYFVEGSGQKIGDKIVLHIQLIDASSDRHLWAEQFNRETKDIFALQSEVAKSIADRIHVIITPEESERIDKPPTANLVAYDYFLKGLDLFYKTDREHLEESIVWFKKALQEDNTFARAYADVAIAYYYLDIYQEEKQYTEQINNYADKALLFDPKLPQSMVAKALYYIQTGAFQQAVPHLEKALEYNPNSAMVINILSEFYTNYSPDTEKYLEYALKGIQLDIAAHDSGTASFIYLHVSNALIQSGFVDEALKYVNKSLEYAPDNLYSAYVKAYVQYAGDRDLETTRSRLLAALQKDTTRLDILQEVAKVCYFLRDYPEAYRYYKKFDDLRKAYNLEIYGAEDAKIALVMDKMGMPEEAAKYLGDYREFTENNHSIYRDLNFAVYYAYTGETQKAIDHMKLFAQQDSYHYWIILFLNLDPLMENIKDLPEYQLVYKQLEDKFHRRHDALKKRLGERGLI